MRTTIPKGSIIASFIYEKSSNLKGYEEMNLLTIEEVNKNEGHLGNELFSNDEKYIFISYWKDLESIEKWKNNKLHISAKKMAGTWYTKYKMQISKLQNDYTLE